MMVEKEILLLATEDYQGLWEVRSHVEELLGRTDVAIRHAVARAVDDLVERDWIRIYKGSLLRDRASPLPKEKARACLKMSASWDLPEAESDALLLAATPEGERAYLSGKDPAAIKAG